MDPFIEHELTDNVIAQFEGASNERLRQITASLVRHLHDFVRENEITLEEWRAGIDFLTKTGQKSDDKRQEFILLSDVFGVSILVDAMNHGAEGTTESTVLGPFYVEGAPELPNGASIVNEGTGGEPARFFGRVTDGNGNPVAGAELDVWSTAPNGLYDIQEPDKPQNMRGRFVTDADGRYEFRTAKPVSYPIPNDGPVGQLLVATGRHPYRPAHVHVIVTADGFEPLTTQLYTNDDPYIDSDAVFAVRKSLIIEYERAEDGGWQVGFDFVLYRA
ncbi:MAG: intradiol ring-cleavage dioxygenase [Dehalococcoidia bacterium]